MLFILLFWSSICQVYFIYTRVVDLVIGFHFQFAQSKSMFLEG